MPAPPPKQWINQNAHAQNRPMPRPNFPLAQQQQQPPMYPIPPPKWAMPAMRPPPPHVRPYFFNPRNGPLPMPQMDKPNMRPPFPHLAQMAQQMNTQAPKVEQEPRLKNTPFVPLQAEKKRNPKSQQHRQKKETEQKESVKNPTVASPVVAVSKVKNYLTLFCLNFLCFLTKNFNVDLLFEGNSGKCCDSPGGKAGTFGKYSEEEYKSEEKVTTCSKFR